MTDEIKGQQPGSAGAGAQAADEEHEPLAEQESAAAMDADVPQPPGGSETTEGQPS